MSGIVVKNIITQQVYEFNHNCNVGEYFSMIVPIENGRTRTLNFKVLSIDIHITENYTTKTLNCLPK